jgi:hypothetical protein
MLWNIPQIVSAQNIILLTVSMPTQGFPGLLLAASKKPTTKASSSFMFYIYV